MQDFWDLGDDEELEAHDSAVEHDESDQDSSEEVDDQSETLTDGEIVTEIDTVETEELESSNLVTPDEPDPVAPPVLKRKGSQRTKRTGDPKWEKMTLIAFVVVFLGLVAWGIRLFYQEAPETNLATFQEDFPIEGKRITFESVETWWRKPVREGDNPDAGVVLRAKLIPCAQIKLSGNGSTTLQVSFRNGEGNLVGDTLSLDVRGGKFVESQSSEITINSTNGFEDPADLHAYANGDLKAWSLNITEDEAANETIVKTRISPANPE